MTVESKKLHMLRPKAGWNSKKIFSHKLIALIETKSPGKTKLR